MIDTGTIAAIATPIGEGGIGVIRVSGSGMGIQTSQEVNGIQQA